MLISQISSYAISNKHGKVLVVAYLTDCSTVCGWTTEPKRTKFIFYMASNTSTLWIPHLQLESSHSWDTSVSWASNYPSKLHFKQTIASRKKVMGKRFQSQKRVTAYKILTVSMASVFPKLASHPPTPLKQKTDLSSFPPHSSPINKHHH